VDPDALAALRPRLLRLARLQLRDEASAEDAVSETLLAVLEQPQAFQGRSQPATWVVGILKHKIVDALRRQARHSSLDADPEGPALIDELFRADGHRVAPAHDWGNPEQLLGEAQFMTVLEACLGRLPAAQARVFLAREWLELSVAEVCKESGHSATNVSVMLFRARMRLRECLETNWIAVT
jgi:RNA polymerase sigma-70 factor (ECF subfamily)